MSNGLAIATHILSEGARIEREKSGKALTPDEASTVKAAAFLRQIAPYLVEDEPVAAPPDTHGGTAR